MVCPVGGSRPNWASVRFICKWSFLKLILKNCIRNWKSVLFLKIIPACRKFRVFALSVFLSASGENILSEKNIMKRTKIQTFVKVRDGFYFVVFITMFAISLILLVVFFLNKRLPCIIFFFALQDRYHSGSFHYLKNMPRNCIHQLYFHLFSFGVITLAHISFYKVI